MRPYIPVWLLATALYALVTLRFHRMFVFGRGEHAIDAVSDDVYITACFGRTLLSGHGAVWYEGAPRVEGYTSPLWTLLLGAFHALPGFREAALGAWVTWMNLALLALLLLLFMRALDAARARADAAAWRVSLALPILFGGGALCYWAAEGFEVVLVACLALLGFAIAAFGAITRKSAVLFGVLLGAGFAARMDSLVYWSGPCLLLASRALHERRSRELAIAAGSAAMLIAVQLAARYGYYGDLLPNTYYLKATNWPLADRLDMGLGRNAPLFPVAAAIWLPFVVPAVRRALGPMLQGVLACALVFTLSVIYSTHNGGDAWGLKAGHDRYTAIGAVFLMLGLAIAVASARVRSGLWLVPVVLLCTGAALDPVMRQPKWLEQHEERLLAAQPPLRNLEREWIEYGKRFEQISLPGARIAICPAGAIVYFSHRGAVDLLGKVDPYVARLPAEKERPPSAYCWRSMPGHNKENDAGTFQRRQPDFSKYRPPKGFKKVFGELDYRGERFFVRFDTPYLRPELREQVRVRDKR